MKTTTEAQANFIKSLVETRVLTDEQKKRAVEICTYPSNYTVIQASNMISEIKDAKRTPRFVPAAAQPVETAFSKIPNGSYAVPAAALIALHVPTRNDFGFFEVRTFKGHKYIRTLHGAPGDFIRSKVDARDLSALYEIIATTPLEFAQAFAREYSVCARCHAELTDAESRALGLGPVCRKAFL